MSVLRVLSERVFKAGYVVRKELHESPEKGGKPLTLTTAYTPNGDYIGSPKIARYLIVKRGIRPQLSMQNLNVCSIGFSTKDGKWHGWSHRAIFGFKKGSTCKKGDCHYVSKRNGGKGAWKAKDFDAAKEMAIDFAESVG